METFGRWSGTVARWLHELAESRTETAVEDSAFLQSRLIDRWWKFTLGTLQKHNALLLVSRAHSADRTQDLGKPDTFRLPELYVRDWV